MLQSMLLWNAKHSNMTYVSSAIMMTEGTPGEACFAWRMIRPSVSSCVFSGIATSLHVNLLHFSPHVTYIILSPSCCLFCGSFNVSVINSISLIFLAQHERSRRHCWILCPGTMFVNRMPKSEPCIFLSAYLMDISLYTYNITSIWYLSLEARNTIVNSWSESSLNVRFSPFSLWTRFIPSMIHAVGCRISSAGDTLFSIFLASEALLVLFMLPTQFASDHGSGPRGYWRTSFMLSFLLEATSIICPNSLSSVFRMTSLFDNFLLTCLLMLLKVWSCSRGNLSKKSYSHMM